MIESTILQRPWAFLLLVVLALGEYVWRVHWANKGYDVRAALGSVGVAAGGVVLKPLGAVVIAGAFTIAAQIAPWQFALSDWRAWLAGFVAVEFAYYWFHRFSHTVRWLWTTHSVHHSAAELTLPAAVRLGWTGILSLGWTVYLPLILIGFPPVMVATLLAANLFYQYFLHTEAVGRLGPLEWVLNTPSHHRAHHASDEAYLDCNFGGVVIVYDRLFGTFRQEPEGGGLTYGLTEPLGSRNPIVIALHEWVRLFRDLKSARPRDWCSIALGRPGRPSERRSLPAGGRLTA